MFRERDDLGKPRRTRLVGHVEERARLRELLLEERHPLVGSLRRRSGGREIRARPVERARHDLVRDAFAWSLVSLIAREVLSRQAAERRSRERRIVGVDELDAMTLRKAMVGGIEVAPVIERRLIALVVHHGRQRVLIGDLRVDDLELDRDPAGLATCGDRTSPR